jgi:ubiquinone/menaquinone biosynthesis C-methylase UbiE
MPIIKTKTNIEVYRHLSKLKDIHNLSGRAENKNITNYINRKIIDKMGFQPEDVVVDVGCGDGSLLSEVSSIIAKGIGVTPTVEETAKLSTFYSNKTNILFITSEADSILQEDNCADKTICNGVLLLLENKAIFKKAVSEISRLTKKGGLIWMGEIANINEYAGRNYGSSISKWLIYLLKNNNFKGFFKGVFTVIKSKFSSQYFLIHPKKMLPIDNASFTELCANCGLELIEQSAHCTIDEYNNIQESKTRTNFIFRKK